MTALREMVKIAMSRTCGSRYHFFADNIPIAGMSYFSVLNMLCFVLYLFFTFRIPANRWALEQAKHNALHYYLLVGITEDLLGFVSVLSKILPAFFRGSVEKFSAGKLYTSQFTKLVSL